MLRHGLGLQPLPHERQPLHRRVPLRGGVREPHGGERLCARGPLPHVPGVLRAPARRPQPLGQAHRGPARRPHGAGGPRHRLHRRQGLHVRQLRGPGRAPHAGLLRDGPRQGGPRGLAGVQGCRPPRGGARAGLRRRRAHARLERASRHVRAGGEPGREERGARRLHDGLRRRGRGGLQDVRGQPPGHRGGARLWRRRPVLPVLRQLPAGARRRRRAARGPRGRHRVPLRHHDRGLRACRG